MELFLTVVHIVSCAFLVLVVLLQSGKGAEISATFGGSSQTIFGSSGGANFFTKFTAVCAAVFMLTALGQVWLTKRGAVTVFEKEKKTEEVTLDPNAAKAPETGADTKTEAKEAAPTKTETKK